ncbi:MAG: hypothetical protein PHQ40_09560 [Anaerolineaceae bacterium]|nr:hypothetical protein [Anaerolineaceae bacterium]
MLLHEKQIVYWSLANPEVEETWAESRLTLDDFILGPFDAECLGERPPESDWSDWFPPPQRMTEWELEILTDWVEIEAEKHDLIPDPDTYSLEDYFLIRRTMNPQTTQLEIPVPPAPILEQAMGYENIHNARYLSLWWEPAGDEAMVSDGFVTFTGHWAGYLAFIHHKLIYHHLAIYNLGSSDDPAEYRPVIDLQERKAYIAKTCDAEIVVTGQWEVIPNLAGQVLLSSDDFEDLLQNFIEQMQFIPSMEEVRQRMEKDHQAVESLLRWLEDQSR